MHYNLLMNTKDKLYHKYRTKSDKTLDPTKQIILNAFGLQNSDWQITETSTEEDTKLAADLKLHNNIDSIMISHRVRNADKYLDKYYNQFTIRAVNRNGGHETEFSKIMKGNADLMFYGFEYNTIPVRWFIAYADVFRSIFEWDKDHEIFKPKSSIIQCGMKQNELNIDSEFFWFDVPSIEQYLKSTNNSKKFIVKHSAGYYKDVRNIRKLTRSDGTKFKQSELKSIGERIDGY